MTSNIFSLAVEVATILLLLATTIPTSSADIFHRPQFHVHVMNELGRNEVLSVQCNCTDRPQPVNYVKVGTEYELVFRKHAIRDTRWTCYLAPDNSRHATFVAYEDATPDYNRNVFWAVKEDGVYFRNPGGHDVLDYKWENGR